MSNEYQDYCNANYGPEDGPTREEQEGDAWEYWHERANKFEAENNRLLTENRDLHLDLALARTALKPFCEADWYSLGDGRYEGFVSGADLTNAKAAISSQMRGT